VRSPAELTSMFRSNGMKITSQRQLLFRLLHHTAEHPSAEALYAQAAAEMPGISLRTVYQTLSDLVEMGELHQIHFDNGPARFDPNVSEHHHLVCDRCGDVSDVYATGTDQLHLEGLQGFQVSSTEIVFRGTCASCTSNPSRSGSVTPATSTHHQHEGTPS
jgi:Fe2+ or Zn2+ uptake regulation protein